jgi:hypothetical protein
MFRKIAIALVAASVFTAPVLAQSTLQGGSTSTPSSEATKPEKAEKSTETPEKAEKTVKPATKRHHAARHHHHGKAAKMTKSTAMVTKHVKTPKFAKAGKVTKSPKRVYGRASKHTPSGMTSH